MDDDHKDPPIQEQHFLGKAKIVDYGAIRVARGLSRRPFRTCSHAHLVYDTLERRIWCKDCENNVEAFDAFALLAENALAVADRLERKEAEIDRLISTDLISVVAKKLCDQWRKKKTVPACPHCKEALLPADFADPIFVVSKELATRKREGDA